MLSFLFFLVWVGQFDLIAGAKVRRIGILKRRKIYLFINKVCMFVTFTLLITFFVLCKKKNVNRIATQIPQLHIISQTIFD